MAGLFDLEYQPPLAKLDKVIDWEMFREPIEKALYEEPKGAGGRSPYDKLMMFKILILQKYYNLGNTQVGKNHGIAISGNNNTVINSEFEEKFTQLVQNIQQTNLKDKSQIINQLNEYKNDNVNLQGYLGQILTRGAEVATLVPAIVTLLGLI